MVDQHSAVIADEQGVEPLLGREPVGDDVIGTMVAPPGILERRKRITSATSRIMDMIEIFEDA